MRIDLWHTQIGSTPEDDTHVWCVGHFDMEEVRCCLFHQSVAEASALVKRKLFHGKACESSKKLIDHLLKENLQLLVASFKEMNNSNTYLCHGQTSEYL